MAKFSDSETLLIVSYFAVVFDKFTIRKSIINSDNELTEALCIDVTGRAVISLDDIVKIQKFLSERKLDCGFKSMFPNQLSFFIVKL